MRPAEPPVEPPVEPAELSPADRVTWQALRGWLQRDAEGRAVLARIAADPAGAPEALDGWLRERASEAPPRVATYVSGGQVDKIITIAQAGVVQLPPAWSPGTAAERRAQRNRERMLVRVRTTWIEGLLERSLHGAALQVLGMEYKPEAVPDRWGMVLQELQHPPRRLSPKTTIVEVFDQLDGELLILGKPGSGKTTMLLELARTLLDQAERDDTLPMPVVFHLSTWAATRRPIDAWLVDELHQRYDIPKGIARRWVDDEKILPLLDGLDEVRREHRGACVEAINAFRERPRQDLLRLVVASRAADYGGLTTKLRLRGAVQLRPLTAAQVDAYLVSAGGQLAGVRAALAHDRALRRLARSPLLLSVMAIAYQGRSGTALPTSGTVEERRDRLFEAYIDRMLTRGRAARHRPRYDRQHTVQWLAWLADALQQQAQTVFYLERLRPDWLPTRALRRRHTLAKMVGIGVSTGLAAGLVPGLPVMGVGLAFGLLSGLAEGLALWAAEGVTLGLVTAVLSGLLSGLVLAMPFGLIAVVVFGLFFGLFFGLTSGLASREEVVDRLSWSLRDLRAELRLPVGCGAAVGLLFGAGAGAAVGLPFGLAAGAVTGVTAGIALGLSSGLVGREVTARERVAPNEGIWRSGRSAVLSGLAAGAAFSLAGGVAFGLVAGVGVGMDAGVPFAPAEGAGIGLLFGVAIGLFFGLVIGLERESIKIVHRSRATTGG